MQILERAWLCKHTYVDDLDNPPYIKLVKVKDCGNPTCPTSDKNPRNSGNQAEQKQG